MAPLYTCLGVLLIATSRRSLLRGETFWSQRITFVCWRSSRDLSTEHYTDVRSFPGCILPSTSSQHLVLVAATMPNRVYEPKKMRDIVPLPPPNNYIRANGGRARATVDR